MRGLVSFFVDHRVTTTMFMGVLVVMGALALKDLGLELMPEIDYPMITIGTIYRGASSEDVESSVTKPIEEVVSQIKGVKTIKSVSMENYSVVMVEFEWGTNLDFAAQDVRDGIGLIRSMLPEGVSQPVVWKFSMSQFPVLMYLVSAEGIDTLKLRRILEDEVKDRLNRVEGVAAVTIWGGKVREIKVILDRYKLEALGISIQQVVQAIRYQNVNVPAGHVTVRQNEVLIRSQGEYRTVEEINHVIVGATKDGRPIFVRDIGHVEDSIREVRNHVRMNGKPAVLIMITKESGANTVKTCNRVKAEIAKIIRDLPKGIDFRVVMDQGHFVQLIANNTAMSGVVGGILAILMMLLFLMDWRPTLIIALAIPLSIITTFIAMDAAHYTLNFMTIVGLALGVGLLVDNAVVVIENIFRHLELGKDPVSAAKDGTSEVGLAITASTFTTIAVFFPLALVKGLTGQLTRGMGLTVGMSVFSSLVVALTLVPMLSSVILRRGRRGGGRTSNPWFSRFREGYGKTLRWCLHHKGVVITSVLAAFIASIVAMYEWVGTEFMPEEDVYNVVLTYKLPIGTSLDETDRISRMVERSVQGIKGITVVSGWVGPEEEDLADMAMGMNPTDVNEGQVWIRLVDKDKRTFLNKDLRQALRKALPELHGVKFVFLDMRKAAMGGEDKPVVIKIFGPSWHQLLKIARQIASTIRKVKGIEDVEISLKPGKPEQRIIVDREKAARLGITNLDVAMAAQVATLGSLAGKFREQGREYDIRVRLDPSEVKNLNDLMEVPVVSKAGTIVPLAQVAHLELSRGPLKITREEKSRVCYVKASVEGRDLGSAMADVERAIEPIRRSLPGDYFIDAGGQYKDMIDTFINLAKAFAASILLVYMIMASQFESFKHPFIIMFTLPLAFIGVVIALLIGHQTLSFHSGAGIVILTGIVVNNAIVFIDYTNQLRRRGMKVLDALVEAGKTRLRPILITSGTTILGMLPMLFSHSQGSEFRSNLASPLIGGLTFATVLTLIVIPVVYALFEHRRIREEG